MFTIQSELLYSHAVFYCILQGIGTTSHAHAGQNARMRDAHDHHARVQARVCRASSCSHAGARISAGHHARMHASIFVAAVLYACSTIPPMSSPIYVHMHVRVKCMLALIHSVFAAQSLQLPQKNSRHTSLDASVCVDLNFFKWLSAAFLAAALLPCSWNLKTREPSPHSEKGKPGLKSH